MVVAAEFQRPAHGVALWSAFDPSVKSDLFSTAVATPASLWFIDPIPLGQPALEELIASDAPGGVIVTNHNHWRASRQLAGQLHVPVFARPTTGQTLVDATPISDGMKLGDFLDVIAVEGASPGEIALYSAANAGTLIVGDALINFEPYGFTFLPSKYCSDQRLMRESLIKLLACNAERIFFAHGMPILSGATSRLRQLIDAGKVR